MNGKTIGFWATTALVALPNAAAGLMYLAAGAEGPVVAQLGYPLHFAMLLGVWKLLGSVALLAPVRNRITEWAYAGYFFTLSGAGIAHLSIGDAAGAAPPWFMLGLLVVSWALRPHATRAWGPQMATARPVGA